MKIKEKFFNSIIMLHNSFKVFTRNFQKQKTVGVLSIGGLGIAIAVAVLIGLWAINELSFDNFHKDAGRTYRLTINTFKNNESVRFGSTFKPFGEEAKAQLPEIGEMCRVSVWGEGEIWIDNVMHKESRVSVTDTNFFTFFTFPLKTGNPATVLSAPDHMVIDETAARKYFPGQNPVGKSVRYDGTDFTIVGVMEDMPANSHLQAHFIVPFFGWYASDRWGGSDIYLTYFKIAPETDFSRLQGQLTNILTSNMDAFKDGKTNVYLEPLQEIHFSPEGFDVPILKGNKSLVMVFLLMALVVLLMACINFINLFISTSFLRAKSIGVKKTHGADKKLLMREFFLETFYYVIAAVAVGLALAWIALPYFNQMANSHIRIDAASPLLWLFTGSLTVFTVFIAGMFPALYMTRFGVVETLRGQFKGKNLSFLQKGLIIVQFTASVVFLISVFFIDKQVHFMVNADLGFDRENILYVESRGEFSEHYEALRNEWLQCPAIADVTQKNSLPTDWRQGWTVGKPGAHDTYLMEMCRIDDNYFDLMGMKIIEGENPFTYAHDSLRYCVINERAARLLGMEHPVGENLLIYGNYYPIKGVVKDAQTKSFHQGVDPQVYLKLTPNWGSYYLFKVKGDPQPAIRVVEAKWKELVSRVPFEYGFLDQTYENLYKAETNAGKILSSAMLVTLLISVVGLFAMAFYSTQRRIKEIGVRKVNGATVGQILLILNRDFLQWVLISFIVACPIAYLFISRWLENFRIRTDISWWVFVLVGLIVALVALITVSYQTWKAATVNPVKALKTE